MSKDTNKDVCNKCKCSKCSKPVEKKKLNLTTGKDELLKLYS
jgi:hypothetical protein